MSYRDLAREIRMAYKDLKNDSINKLYYVTWNNKLGTSEITVENDGGFRAIIIGNVNGNSRGYMYLFYTNDDNVSFPTIKEIERRLRIITKKENLEEKDSQYFNWKEFGNLEKQKEYFAEVIKCAI